MKFPSCLLFPHTFPRSSAENPPGFGLLPWVGRYMYLGRCRVASPRIRLTNPIHEMFTHCDGFILWFLPLFLTDWQTLNDVVGIAHDEKRHAVSGLFPHRGHNLVERRCVFLICPPGCSQNKLESVFTTEDQGWRPLPMRSPRLTTNAPGTG